MCIVIFYTTYLSEIYHSKNRFRSGFLNFENNSNTKSTASFLFDSFIYQIISHNYIKFSKSNNFVKTYLLIISIFVISFLNLLKFLQQYLFLPNQKQDCRILPKMLQCRSIKY